VEKIFAVNPNHALGHATKGALLLLRAQTAKDGTTRSESAQKAAAELALGIKQDAFLKQEYAPLQAQAEQLMAAR
jgi:hypothetical protein